MTDLSKSRERIAGMFDAIAERYDFLNAGDAYCGQRNQGLGHQEVGSMALLEITQSRQITATIRLEEKTAAQVDQYAAFIHAPADEVVNHALDYVFSKDRDFQEFLKSGDAAAAAPSLRVRRTPQPAEPQEKPSWVRKANVLGV